MKSALSLTLSFLLAFTTIFPLSFSRAPEEVKDSEGEPISTSGKYCILPFKGGPKDGGGLIRASNDNSTCYSTILQLPFDGHDGVPVKFSRQGRSSGGILTGTPLGIAFDDAPSCVSSTKWVVISDDFPKKWLGIGGARDHPGKKIIGGAFKIEKYNGGYKFVFCVSTRHCYNIGTDHNAKGGHRLILTHDPFHVQFDPKSNITHS